jgi:YVTN family beta-propeller protein
VRATIRLPIVAILALLTLGAEAPARYPSPVELALSADENRLFILCEGTDAVVVYNLRAGKIQARIPVGHVPKGISLTSDARRLFVANSWSDSVSEIDTGSLAVVRTLPAGFEPNAAVPDREGRYLYIANRVGNDVSVVDLATGEEVKRLAAGRGASYLTLSPDGGRIYCTHIYPLPGQFREVPLIRDHGDRHVQTGGRRAATAGGRRRRVPHGDVVRRPARDRSGDAAQELDPTRARGARLGDRECPLDLRSRCR